MKVGYVVEGSTDRALLAGLQRRWCPGADLEELRFRGSRCRHRQYPKVCADARLKDVDVLVLLTDANGRKWKTVKSEELKALPSPCPLDVLVGVCDRNVECWLCADRVYAAKHLGCNPPDLSADDPKRTFERALEIRRDQKHEDAIAGLVEAAPLRSWIKQSPSFRGFYEDARDIAQRRACAMPNEEEGT